MVVFCAASTARADKDAARAAFTSGNQHYNLAEYKEALEEFKRAYRESNDPTLLFNIGQCQRQLADYEGAEKSYRAFLRETPDVSPKTWDDVQRLMAEMTGSAINATTL